MSNLFILHQHFIYIRYLFYLACHDIVKSEFLTSYYCMWAKGFSGIAVLIHCFSLQFQSNYSVFVDFTWNLSIIIHDQFIKNLNDTVDGAQQFLYNRILRAFTN